MQDHATMTPEAGSPATWYGSAIHDAIEAAEDGYDDTAAIELAWSKWGSHLEPDDLALLEEDLAKYRERDFQNVRTVLSEGEIKVPLTTMPDGRPIWFRARIDRLYERLDRPGCFVHVDYKSSKWVKTQEEMEADLQLWAYNWGLNEFFPEIDTLEQWLDQLRGGMGEPVFKSPDQREEMREWLAVEARRYFATLEGERQEDGLPLPQFNQWCPWCPILESCSIVPQLTDWALTRIHVLSPDELEQETVTPVGEYIDRYDDAQTAVKTLERYVESVRALVRDAPRDRRALLGFELRDRRASVVDLEARERLYDLVGHRRFMEMVKVTQTQLKSIDDEGARQAALGLVEKIPGSKVVHRIRR